MALRPIFQETFADGPSASRVQISCFIDDESPSQDGLRDTGVVTLTARGIVYGQSSDEVVETFECGVRAEFRNPIMLAAFTGALLPYGACVALRIIGALMEAANDGYENTKLKAKHGWRSGGETAAAVANDVVRQTPKLRGKVLSALVVCIPLAGLYSAATI